MSEFFMNLATIFGGVFGAAIGFFLIALTAALLVLPYFLMNRKSQESKKETGIGP